MDSTDDASPGTTPPRITIHNPATGEQVGSVAIASADDVAAAAARARTAQASWHQRPWGDRRRIVERFHDLVLDRADEVLDTIQSESGKSRRDAVTELMAVTGTARYYCAHGRRYLRPRRARAAVPLVTRARVERTPVGLVGLITPWNYPFLLGVGDALPALLAGNAVLAKPSEVTPLSAELAHRLLVEAGLDPDLLQLVHGPGPTVGSELLRHVDYIGFTGSTATGRRIATAAAERLIPCSLELGGKNPMIVLDGADIDDAVTGLINGAFCNSGQTCISIERVYVEDSIHDRFVAAAVERTQELTLQWSTDWGNDMGSLVSIDQADRVEQHLTDAVSQGAAVLVGGRRRTDLGPAFIEPTLLANVSEPMLAAIHETFGPVASIERVATAEDALALANRSSYGLAGTIWAGSRRKARQLARRLDVGSAGINATLLIYATIGAPMGGVRESGLGRRHGPEGITRYTNLRTIVSSVPWAGGIDSITRLITSDRRLRLLARVLRVWRHLPGLR